MIEKKSKLPETKDILKFVFGLLISILITSIFGATILSKYEGFAGVVTYSILIILASFHSFFIPLFIYTTIVFLVYQAKRNIRLKIVYIFLLSILYPMFILILDLNFFSKCHEIISYLKFCQYSFLFSIVSVIVANLLISRRR